MTGRNVDRARLHLRPLHPDDAAEHHALVGSDPNVTWNGKAITLEESRRVLEGRARHWDEHGFGMWAVLEKGTGRMLGHAGLQRLEETGEVEVAYYLGRPAWGKGYATEAGAAALGFGFEILSLPRVMAVVRPENHASQRVLAKLGLRHLRDEPHYGFEVQLWGLDRNLYRPGGAPPKAHGGIDTGEACLPKLSPSLPA